MRHISHWIGGKPWSGEAARRGDVYNPATGQVTGTVDFAGRGEVAAAAAAAAAALPGWRETSLVKRASVMFAFRELLLWVPKTYATWADALGSRSGRSSGSASAGPVLARPEVG